MRGGAPGLPAAREEPPRLAADRRLGVTMIDRDPRAPAPSGPPASAPSPVAARYGEVHAIALAEMVAAVRRPRGALTGRAVELALSLPAAALARSLVHLDHAVAVGSVREAGLERLRHYGMSARVQVSPGGPLLPIERERASLPPAGPLLVLSNHPGLLDVMLLFAAIGRDDLAVLAARRPLLTALPNLSRHLLSIDPGAAGAVALKKAVRHLQAGGALLHFPAGLIEPDPRIAPAGTALLLPWKPGLEILTSAAARWPRPLAIVPAVVSGVLSKRALALAGALGRGDGLTDALVPLLQLTFPGFSDTDACVRFGAATSGAPGVVPRLREELAALAAAARGISAGSSSRAGP
jgi:hypothetical protein